MKIGVYGLGRFGYVWSELLARQHDVVAWSRDPTRSVPPSVRKADEHEVTGADALFLCVAISAMDEVCARIAPALGDRTAVLDTCSVKVRPAQVMEAHIRAPTPILATHPMFGPDSVGGGRLPLVLCPVRADEALVRGWEERFRGMGLDVQVMTPQEHDHRAAYTQGVTHLVGRVLKDLGLEDSPMATLGYRKLLEIVDQTCNDTWQLFLDLQRYNPYTTEMRRRLRESFEKIVGNLEP